MKISKKDRLIVTVEAMILAFAWDRLSGSSAAELATDILKWLGPEYSYEHFEKRLVERLGLVNQCEAALEGMTRTYQRTTIDFRQLRRDVEALNYVIQRLEIGS